MPTYTLLDAEVLREKENDWKEETSYLEEDKAMTRAFKLGGFTMMVTGQMFTMSKIWEPTQMRKY